MSSMMEALGGAPPGMAGPPPGLMGAGGPPPGIEGPPGPDTGGPPPPDEGGEDFANSLEALQVAQEALQAFIRLDPDHADRAVAAQCLQNVIKLIQSNKESADGGDLMSLTRALQGGPSANTGGAAGY